MTDLQNTFGEEFVETYNKKIQQRQESRNKLPSDAKQEIADRCINQGELDGGNPMFNYTDSEGNTHRVMLMEFPDMEEGTVYQYANELQTGAVSIPFEYLGTWISCLFNEGKDHVAEFEEGSHYVIAGRHGTYETNDGEEREQLSPVTAIMSLEELQELANEAMENEGFDESDESGDSLEEFGSDGEDTEPDEPEAESDGEDDSLNISLGDDSDSEDEEDDGPTEYNGIPVQEVIDKTDELAEKDEKVEQIDPGTDWAEKFGNVLAKFLEYDDNETLEEIAVTYINEGEDAAFALGEPDEEETDDSGSDDQELFTLD